MSEMSVVRPIISSSTLLGIILQCSFLPLFFHGIARKSLVTLES